MKTIAIHFLCNLEEALITVILLLKVFPKFDNIAHISSIFGFFLHCIHHHLSYFGIGYSLNAIDTFVVGGFRCFAQTHLTYKNAITVNIQLHKKRHLLLIKIFTLSLVDLAEISIQTLLRALYRKVRDLNFSFFYLNLKCRLFSFLFELIIFR